MAEVRAATLADIAALVALTDEVQRLHAENEPTVFRYPADTATLTPHFETAIQDEQQHLVMARRDGKPAGYFWAELQCREANAFRYAGRRFFVHHFSVAETCRRQGVGTALMQHAVGIARSLGCNELALDTWAWNSTAQAFFVSQGFARYRIFLRRPVA